MTFLAMAIIATKITNSTCTISSLRKAFIVSISSRPMMIIKHRLNNSINCPEFITKNGGFYYF